MTVLAWDGKTLAADRRCCRGDTVFSVRKVFRVGELLVGMAGPADHVPEFLKWVRDGRDPAMYPAAQKTEDWVVGMVIERGRATVYDRSPSGVRMLDRFIAMGSGREVALGVMEMGATARQAVAAANRWISSCGNGIDTLAARS